MKRIILTVIAALWVSAAYAQSPVTTLDAQLPTLTIGNVTISPANTFSQILAAATKRRGCTIQYNGSGTGFVFVGANAAATLSTSFQLKAQQTFNCSLVGAGAVITDAIQGTSTVTSDNFNFTQQ